MLTDNSDHPISRPEQPSHPPIWEQLLPGRLPPGLEPPDPESPRGRILAAARELFAERGFGETSTRTIADRAGVNLAMLNYYFGNKELLYRRAVAGQFILMARDLLMALPPDLPPEELIIGQPRRIIAVLRRHPVGVKLVRRELAEGGDRLKGVLQELGDAGPAGAFKTMLAAYEKAAGAGRLKSHPPLDVIQFLISISYGFAFLAPFFEAVMGVTAGDDQRWDERLKVFEGILRKGLEAGEGGDAKSD